LTGWDDGRAVSGRVGGGFRDGLATEEADLFDAFRGDEFCEAVAGVQLLVMITALRVENKIERLYLQTGWPLLSSVAS